MEPDAFNSTLFKWDPRTFFPSAPPPTNRPQLLDYTVAPPVAHPARALLGGLEELFHDYGIRYYTAAKVAELGFTASTLLDMKDEELDDMMNSLSQIFRWDLLVGERYGIKAAVRAERRRIDDQELKRRNHLSADTTTNALDALSQEGLSEEPVMQQEKEVVGAVERRKQKQQRRRTRMKVNNNNNHRNENEDPEDEEEEEENNNSGGGYSERQREHPFIVTEPGEVARGKKNGLDYLFHLYEQCREFLIQVQHIAKDRGEKCPTKVSPFLFKNIIKYIFIKFSLFSLIVPI
ncbi:putative transcription factor LFY family [Lupinus albus]|uniref:Floricaula/leafy-like transcription factor n=1 Tax=Lupinus albus TaxID=3870 RepID=A0A6A4Q8L4_LUPAL|nr:putative transcription factor LFY family [Lupinus albus]